MRILILLLFPLFSFCQVPFSAIEKTDLLQKYVLGSNFSGVDGKVKPVTVGALGVELGLARPLGEVVYGTGTGVTSSQNLTINGSVLSLKNTSGTGANYINFKDNIGAIGFLGAGSSGRELYYWNYGLDKISFGTNNASRLQILADGNIVLNKYTWATSVPIIPAGSLLFDSNGTVGTSTVPLRLNSAFPNIWNAEGKTIQNKNNLVGYACVGVGYIKLGEFQGFSGGGTCYLKVVGGNGYNSSMGEHAQVDIFLRNGNGNTSDGTKNLSITVNRFGFASNTQSHNVKAIPKTNVTGAATNWDIYLEVASCMGGTELIVETGVNTNFLVGNSLNAITALPTHPDMVSSVDVFAVRSEIYARNNLYLNILNATFLKTDPTGKIIAGSPTDFGKPTKATNAITQSSSATADTSLLGGVLDRNTTIQTTNKDFWINSNITGYSTKREFSVNRTKFLVENTVGSDSSYFEMDGQAQAIGFGNRRNETVGGIYRLASDFKVNNVFTQEVVQDYKNTTTVQWFVGGVQNDIKNTTNKLFLDNKNSGAKALFKNELQGNFLVSSLGVTTITASASLAVMEGNNFFSGSVVRILMNGLPIAVDNSTAISAGMLPNQIYQTPSGELRIRQ
jgi:hypothetical protein